MAGPDDDPNTAVGATQHLAQGAQRGDASSCSELSVRVAPALYGWQRLRARLTEETWPRGLLDD